MNMKVYKNKYDSPKIDFLTLEDSDILTSSSGSETGTETPVIDESGVWKQGN